MFIESWCKIFIVVFFLEFGKGAFVRGRSIQVQGLFTIGSQRRTYYVGRFLRIESRESSQILEYRLQDLIDRSFRIDNSNFRCFCGWKSSYGLEWLSFYDKTSGRICVRFSQGSRREVQSREGSFQEVGDSYIIYIFFL